MFYLLRHSSEVLNRRGDFLSEMGRLYRLGMRGEMPSHEAKARASILQGAVTILKDGEAEHIAEQIAALRAPR
jgi:hypothetical protein